MCVPGHERVVALSRAQAIERRHDHALLPFAVELSVSVPNRLATEAHLRNISVHV